MFGEIDLYLAETEYLQSCRGSMQKEGSLERNREDQEERKSTGCKDDTHIRAEEDSGKESC